MHQDDFIVGTLAEMSKKMLEKNTLLEAILTPLPHRPYCTDDFADGLRIRSLKAAKNHRYLQINPPTQQHYLIFDVDRQGAAFAWEDCTAPPNYAAVNPENGHAHLVYKLAEPVTTSEYASQKALRYLAAVERAYRIALGADAGYSGLITRNPYKSRTLCLHTRKYDLFELTDWLKNDLGHYAERETVVAGLGRNVTLFDRVRVWAYTNIRLYRVKERSKLFETWHKEVLDYSLSINAQFPTPLAFNEVKATAKSIAKYCWGRDSDAQLAFSKRQSERGVLGGKASGIARSKANEDKRIQARLLAAKGISTRKIAAELYVNQSTVSRWLKEVMHEA